MTVFIIGITEHINVTDLQFCKHEDLRITWERKSILDSLIGIGGRFKAFVLTETIAISETIDKLLHMFRNIVETIDLVAHVRASNPLQQFITLTIQEVGTLINERLIARTEGPSWRWRFNPWKKSSYDDVFTPLRNTPTITMPTLPESKQLEMVKMVFKKGFGLIFPFKDD